MWIAARILRNARLKMPTAVFVAAFAAGLIFPTFALAAAIKIMPLGDSITVGSNSGVSPDNSSYYISYRKVLKDRLVADGYAIDYVGSQAAGGVVFADPQHEGHSGWFAAGTAATSILPKVDDFLTATPADIILLHIGTNDISTGQDPAAVRGEIEDILDAIDAYEQRTDKDVWVILALIVNQATGCAYRSQTTSMNNFLESMADARQLNGDKIVVVDMEIGAGLDYDIRPNGDMFNCLHPYATGYTKMADEWLQGLLTILPRARAGSDQNANPGVPVNLDGTGSSDSRLGTTNTYAWSQTSGSPSDVDITGADTLQASFTAPSVSGGTTLTFRLTITDDKNFSHSDTCNIIVNGPPIAAAGADQVAITGASVTLDGTASTDPGGAIATYQWVQTAGNPVTVTNKTTSKANFTAPPVGSGGADLIFDLTVADNSGAQDSDTCIVHVNGPPEADAGADQRVLPGDSVTLDGTRSVDADGSIVAYRWLQVGGSPVGTIQNSDKQKATFTMPAIGSGDAGLAFQLTVTDDLGVASSDTVLVKINEPPKADAGADQQAEAGAIVVLDGSGSTDDGSASLSYAWVQTSGPAVALSDPASARTSFSAPRGVESDIALVFLLTVTDAGGLQSADSCRVTVTPEESSSGSGGGGGGGGCFITTAGDRGTKSSFRDRF